MSRLVDIKTKLAKENGYNSFYDFIKDNTLNHSPELSGAMMNWIDVLCKEYATECAKETLKQADKRVKSSWKCSPSTAIIIKTSILNESNITLL